MFFLANFSSENIHFDYSNYSRKTLKLLFSGNNNIILPKSCFWQIKSDFPETLHTTRTDSAIDESDRISRKIENLAENLAKKTRFLELLSP